MKRILRPSILIPVAVALGIALAWGTFAVRSSEKPEELRLDEFESRVESGDVEWVTIYDRDNRVAGELSSGEAFATTYPREYAATLTEKIRSRPEVRVEVKSQREPYWRTLLTNAVQVLIPLLLVGILLWFFVLSPQAGFGRSPFAKAKSRKLHKDEPETTFEDVAGLDEAVEELTEIRDFLEAPEKFAEIGARVPKGVLLFGPPGTGKTLLAKAVAGEAHVPFFSISGSDFVEMFVGVGASRIRDLFQQAKSESPAIIFVDEIDAVGRQRGTGLGGGHDEREQTLNQLLVEMDGFDSKTGIVLMGATNRPDILDPALLRPGRFDRHVVVDRPDLDGRRGILAVHARGKPLDETVDLDVIARRTPGFTGADLANLVNEAALIAARRGLKKISMAELEEAIDRVVAGPERKTRVISDEEKKRIAYHEGGHALVGHVLPHAHPIHKISIIPRGRALGYTLALPEVDKYLVTRSELLDELTVLMGGRTAEELIFADPTTGAQDDIDKATEIARQMVCEFGMSESLGPLSLGHRSDEVFLGRDISSNPDYSDTVAAEIDAEIRKLIDAAHEEARKILTANREVLDRLAAELTEKETLDTDEVEEIFSGLGVWKSAYSSNGDRQASEEHQRGGSRG